MNFDNDDLDIGFELGAESPAESFKPLPPGPYQMNCEKVEINPTKDGTGRRLVVTLVVTEGDHVGRRIWQGFNINNNNPKAQEISRRQLSSLSHAAGCPGTRNAADLVGNEVIAHVKVQPAKDGFDARNECTAYESLIGDGPKPAAAAPSEKKKPSFMR